VRPDRSDGVFETMLVRDGRIQVLAQHLDRLARSSAALYGLRLPPGLPGRLRAHVAGAAGEHRLRVDVVPGEDIAVTMAAVAPGSRHAVTLAPLVVPGGLGAHKWRDRRLLDVAARYRGAISGYGGPQTPLLVDSDGTVLEAAWGNVWVLDGDALITPPADGRILPGVTRALLLELAPSLGLRPREDPISLHRMRAAPVTFATSAIRLAVAAGLDGQAAPPTAAVDRIRAALGAHC
jgi:para-aminobenzoate synthetase / 4-amino-4-deoxychorismate lyase